MGAGALKAPTRSTVPAMWLVKHLSLKQRRLSPVSGNEDMVCMTSGEKYSALGVPWPFFSCFQRESSTLSNGGPLFSSSSHAQREMSSHLLVVSYVGKCFKKGREKNKYRRQKVKANAVCRRRDCQSHVLK